MRKKVLFCLIILFNLVQMRSQTKWDSIMFILQDLLSYEVYVSLYKNHKPVNLLDGRSKWFMITTTKDGKNKVDEIIRFGETSFISFSKSKSNGEKKTIILQRGNKFYDFPLHKLDTIHSVWVFVKHVDNIWSSCFLDVRKKLRNNLGKYYKDSLYKDYLKNDSGYIKLTKRNCIGIYNKFYPISDEDKRSNMIIDYVFPLTIYTREEYKRKNKELKSLIMLNKSEKTNFVVKKKRTKKRKCFYEGIIYEL